jgi:AcrR family transcriptional regulator
MGHREDLLAGAKRCLIDKGYARTTARDIVAASHTNLASIGYHFGSKEALMNTALIEATAEFGDALQNAMPAGLKDETDPLERFRTVWTSVITLFTTHRELWSANFEILAQVEHAPDVRQALAGANSEAREGLAALFADIDPAVDPEGARVLGTLHQALLVGVMAQWLTDPETAPTGDDLLAAMKTLIAPSPRP